MVSPLGEAFDSAPNLCYVVHTHGAGLPPRPLLWATVSGSAVAAPLSVSVRRRYGKEAPTD